MARKRKPKRKLSFAGWFLLALSVLCVIVLVKVVKTKMSLREEVEKPTIVEKVEEVVIEEPVVEEVYDFEGADSLLILANKAHPLKDGYEPSDLVKLDGIYKTQDSWMLRSVCKDAVYEMFEAAKKDGVVLEVGSAYRSAAYQASLWQSYANQYGSERADRISSRPNHSDHQTGLCIDVVENNGAMDGVNYCQEFETTRSAQWLFAHAHEYGFILRYPKGKEEITGYNYEPWHYRFIGQEHATKLHEAGSDMTFEEFFNVEGGKQYKD